MSRTVLVKHKPITYDGGWFYPLDPYYCTVDSHPLDRLVEIPAETEFDRNKRLYAEAVEADKSLTFRYAAGSRPGERRTVKPFRHAYNDQNFKAKEGAQGMKTFLFDKITEMEIVNDDDDV